MKKANKSIIVLLCAVIVLGAAYWLISRDSSDTDSEKSEVTQTETVKREGSVVFETEQENISSVTINNGETYEIYSKDGKWSVRGSEDILFNQATLNSTVLDYVKVVPTLIVEETSEKKASYGLEKPSASATVKTFDGTEKTFYIGDETKGGNGYYFMISDDDRIYTVSTVLAENMKKSINEYRTTSLFEASADEIKEISMTVFGTGDVTVQKLDEKLDAMTSWKMTKPFELGVYDEKFSEIVITPVISVEAIGFVSDNPTDEQLEKSGLKNPQTYYEVKTENQTYKVLIGNNYDGNYIVKREDLPSVYLVPSESLTFLFADIFEYLNSYAYLPSRDELSSISTVIEGVQYEFSQKNYSDKDNREFYINEYSVDNKVFSEGYKSIVGIKIDGRAKNIPQDLGEPEFSYSVKLSDGSVENVSYVRMNGMYMYQFINGKCEFYVKSADVDAAKQGVTDALEDAKNPELTEEQQKEKKAEKEKKTTNALAYVIVVLIIALIAVFPISMLLSSKKKN